MRFVPAALIVLFACVLCLPVHARTACAQAAPLRINEIMAGPASDWNGDATFSSRDDEWIEIVNMGSSAVDLADFFVMDGDSVPRCGLTGLLPASGHRVVFGKEAYDWEKATGYPAFGLSLANTGDRVTLWQVAGAETLFVDGYTYGSHEAGSDRSVGRAPDGGDSWAVFDQLNPYAGTTPPSGNGCPPTPGQPNGCDLTPVRATTWGAIKSIYR
jgi:hypothetical protein